MSYFYRVIDISRRWSSILSAAQEDSRQSGGSRYVFAIMLIHRLGHEFATGEHNSPITVMLQLLQNALAYYLRHIEFPFTTPIGTGVRLPHPKNITLNSSAKVGERCTIYHNVTIGAFDGDSNAAPLIGDNVLIGTGAVVLGPISIGANAQIGANAVVTRDVPPGATVVGINRLLEK